MQVLHQSCNQPCACIIFVWGRGLWIWWVFVWGRGLCEFGECTKPIWSEVINECYFHLYYFLLWPVQRYNKPLMVNYYLLSCFSIGIAHLLVCFTMPVKFELALIYFVINFKFWFILLLILGFALYLHVCIYLRW